jgi:hypothetical protein
METAEETEIVAGKEPKTPYNPKAAIEEAQKDWEAMGKPPEAEKPPEKDAGKEPKKKPDEKPPEKEESAAEGKDGNPLGKKDGVIKDLKASQASLKAEMARQQRKHEADLKAIEEKYSKALEEKNDVLAEIAKQEYEREVKENALRSQENFFAQAETEVNDISSFRFNASHYIPKLKANPHIEALIMETEKPYAVMEMLFSHMADNGILAEALVRQEAPTLRKWIGEISKEVSGQSKEPAKPEAPAAAPAQPPKAPPKSVVASVGGDSGDEAKLDTKKASMEDVIRHVRKHGANGIE